MPAQLKILRINHINQIVDDYDSALSHLQDVFGGQFLRRIGANPVTAGCLVDVGGEIIELLAPKIMDKAEGKQLTKYGPHYQGIELMVPSVSEALEVIKARGIRTLLERGGDFYTMPSATQGVCLQVYDGPRIWATTFAVRDLNATAAYFSSRDIELRPGDAPDSLMVPPERNLHVVYQFVAQPGSSGSTWVVG